VSNAIILTLFCYDFDPVVKPHKTKCFSICAGDDQQMALDVTVKRDPQDLTSTMIHLKCAFDNYAQRN
jgi:hypothetical protein